jgi:hypothetical protein
MPFYKIALRLVVLAVFSMPRLASADGFLDQLSCPRFSWTAICPTGGSHDEVQHEQD